jgi:hypothetical protein
MAIFHKKSFPQTASAAPCRTRSGWDAGESPVLNAMEPEQPAWYLVTTTRGEQSLIAAAAAAAGSGSGHCQGACGTRPLSCTQVALTYEMRKTQAQRGSGSMGNNGVYVLVPAAVVPATRLENRQSFTGLVSLNLTLSASLDETALIPRGRWRVRMNR